MAEIQDGGRGGRARNVELNLVPFIDLMSVLITFLLLSAVWTQVSMIQLGASFVSRKDDDTEVKPPPMEDFVLRLDVKKSGYVLHVGKDVINVPMTSDNKMDNSVLLEHLMKVKTKFPDKGDVKMAVADDIPYELLIAAMDVSLKAGFTPGILTGGVN